MVFLVFVCYINTSYRNPGFVHEIKIFSDSIPAHPTENVSIEISSSHRSQASMGFAKLKDSNYDTTPTKFSHQRYISTDHDDPESIIQGKAGSQVEKELEDENSGPMQIDVLGNKPIIDEIEEEEYSSRSPTSATPGEQKIQKFDDVIVTETRFCTICTLEQPMRAKHCRDCGKCVALHDHHCPWLGICIGERNRRQF
mmetsp:Transcript_30267/g.29924  ORF Transcript_30267/g.29924 Transcript_30267/m.29924 type:complete len:198 (-) Transcript_30267:296-889(-)